MGALADAYAVLKEGTLWSSTGKCKGYAASNPGEAKQVDAYVAALDVWVGAPTQSPPSPPSLATKTGQGEVGMLAALAVEIAKNGTPPTPPSTEPPSLVSNSLAAGATLTGIYSWVVATAGDCAKCEFWASSATVGNRLLAVIEGTTPFTFAFDTSTLANGGYRFGIVLVDSGGVRYPDDGRVDATVSNAGSTPPPSGGGKMKYKLDYSTGNFAQWNEGGDHMELVAGATATVGTGYPLKGPGGYAAKFTLPNLTPGGPRGRCQTYLNGHSDYGCEGIEEWYAMSFMVAKDSVLWSGGWNNLCSWHNQDQKNTNMTEGHWTLDGSQGAGYQIHLAVRGGKVPPSSGGPQYAKDFVTSWKIEFDRRYDLLTHIKWSTDPTVGFVEAWIDGKRFAPFTKTGTLFFRQGSVEPDAIYYKCGYDNGGEGPATVYEAAHNISTDYANAISLFDAGKWPGTPPA